MTIRFSIKKAYVATDKNENVALKMILELLEKAEEVNNQHKIWNEEADSVQRRHCEEAEPFCHQDCGFCHEMIKYKDDAVRHYDHFPLTNINFGLTNIVTQEHQHRRDWLCLCII